MDVLFKIATIEAAIRLGLPVALAALGAIISERSGVLNLGLEGMMLSGALGGYMANEATGSPWLGLLVGLLVGAFAGAILAGLVVSMRTNQVVTGIAFTLVAAAVTTYLFQLRWSIGDVPPRVQRLGMTPLIIVTLVCLVSVWFCIVFCIFLFCYFLPVVWGFLLVRVWVLIGLRLGSALFRLGSAPYF